jgi:hypothetical protein
MLDLLVHIVPFALTSINVPAVLITIVILKSQQGLPKALAYVEGIAACYVTLAALFMLAIARVPGSSEPPSAIRSILYAGVGAMLILVAVKTYKTRAVSRARVKEPAGKQPGKLMARLMQAPEKLGPRLLFALGFLMALTGIKNLILFGAGMTDVTTRSLTLIRQLLATAVLILALIWWEIVPVLVYTFVPHRANTLLDDITDWMKTNQRLVLAAVCLIIGLKMVIEGVVDLITLATMRLPF